jgi:hypothetical protein
MEVEVTKQGDAVRAVKSKIKEEGLDKELAAPEVEKLKTMKMALQALTKQHTELCATVRTSTLPPPRVWGAGVRTGALMTSLHCAASTRAVYLSSVAAWCGYLGYTSLSHVVTMSHRSFTTAATSPHGMRTCPQAAHQMLVSVVEGAQKWLGERACENERPGCVFQRYGQTKREVVQDVVCVMCWLAISATSLRSHNGGEG